MSEPVTPREQALAEVLLNTIKHLPDSNSFREDESWHHCWNELSGEAQDAVKEARRKAFAILEQP